MPRLHRLRRPLARVATAVTALTVTLAVLPAPAAAAEGVIVGADAPGVLPDAYIVVFKDRTADRGRVDATARTLTDRFGGTRGRSYAGALRGFSVRMPEAAARRLAASPSVAYVEADRVVSASDVQPGATWGLDRIDQRTLPLSGSYDYQATGAGVTAYILDSGVRTTHDDFGGRARDGYDFIDNDGVAQDCNGHGTHVAGTVGGTRYGVAKDVTLVGVRVLNCSGRGSYSQIIAGVDWVTGNAVRPAVANMSLGGPTGAALNDAVRRSIASGVTYVVAAGNDGVDACTQSPASTAEAITVGASDQADTRASFSNHGTCLDVYAPGVGIRSSAYGSDTATASMSGTSMASPHVAGAAALILQRQPSATPRQVRDQLDRDATPATVADARPGSPDGLLFTAPTPPADAPVVTPPTQAPPVVTPPTQAPPVVTPPTQAPPVVTPPTNTPPAVTPPTRTPPVVTPPPAVTPPADGRAPTVSIVSPRAGAALRGRVTVTAAATDNTGVARLDLLVNGRTVATDRAAPWSLGWTPGTDGAVTLTVRAYDRAGNSATATRTARVDNSGPALSVGGPAAGRPVRGRVTVPVRATDPSGIARVQLLIDNRVVATDTTFPYAPTWNSGTRHGTVTLRVRGYDRLGNVRTVIRQVRADNRAPTLRVRAAPRNSAKVRGTVKITVAATDAYGIARVQVLVNNRVAATDTRAPYTLSVATARHPRRMVVRIRAYDHAGNVTYSPTRTWHRR